MTKSEIKYEIRTIQSKLRYIAEYDLWEVYDVSYLEEQLAILRAKLEKVDI